jgi:HlyD family secretion protein
MRPAAISVRAPVLLGGLALMALILGFGAWATQASLAGAVIVKGRVESPVGHQVLQHPDGGVVTGILVRDGDLVEAGQVLLRLDGAALASDLRILEDRLSDYAALTARLEAERDGLDAPAFPAELLSLAASRAEVASQVDGQERLFAARSASLAELRAQLRRRIDQVEAQGNGLEAQRTSLMKQLDLVEAERAAQQGLLDRGLALQGTVLSFEREAARLAGQIGEVSAALARVREQVTEIEIQISALHAQRREEAASELRVIGPVIQELTERQRALVGQIARLELRAPVAGVVHDLRIRTIGAVVRPAETILSIVPQDGPLIVSARIDPAVVDGIWEGQAAELVFPVLDPGIRLRQVGRVTAISPDILTDPHSGAPHYLARIELLPPKATDPVTVGIPQPGMPVDVFLQTASRTPLAYLLEPVTAYFDRALHDP